MNSKDKKAMKGQALCSASSITLKPYEPDVAKIMSNIVLIDTSKKEAKSKKEKELKANIFLISDIDEDDLDVEQGLSFLDYKNQNEYEEAKN